MFVLPGVSDFKAQFARDFPFASEAVQATAAATFNVNGVITAVTPVDRGLGYTSRPTVIVVDGQDGPGDGAVVVAILTNGQISGYTVMNGGTGYVAPQLTVQGGGLDDTNLDYVQDFDVRRALLAAGVNFNAALWADQPTFTYAFCLKAAHFLCVNLKASTQGLRGRGGEWLRNAFSVGDISAAYTLPDKIVKSPILGPLLETTYGNQYLQLVAPQLVGNVMAAVGWSKP